MLLPQKWQTAHLKRLELRKPTNCANSLGPLNGIFTSETGDVEVMGPV